MNLLIIGNGFDIALGLKTKYTDFLDFAHAIDIVFPKKSDNITVEDITSVLQDIENNNWNMPQYMESNFPENKKHNYKKSMELISEFIRPILPVFHEDISAKACLDFLHCIKDNMWMKYFIQRYKSHQIAGENWIDIEHEIETVIKRLENNGDEKIFNVDGNQENKTIKLGDISAILEYQKIQICEHQYRGFKTKLRADFDRFVMALNIYLDIIAGQVNHKLPSDIDNVVRKENQEMNYLISFNYTDRFKDVFKGQMFNPNGICYVHGRTNYLNRISEDGVHISYNNTLESIIKDNNMVIGFDEYRRSTSDEDLLDFVYYRKYFQRILKRTGNPYLDWLSQPKKGNDNSHVYIFGHSLDAMDKEIFFYIFHHHSSVKTTIFYHNNEAKDRIITNLIRILGKEELISQTYGIEPQIEFVMQDQNSYE